MKKWLFFFAWLVLPVVSFSDGTITGTVTDSSGNPIENAAIQLYRNGASSFSGTTNSSGVYTITVTNYGFRDVECTASGYKTQIKVTKLKNNRTVTVNFTMETNPGTLTGTVTDTSTPANNVNGATVTVSSASIIYGTTTTSSGSYTISTLPAGPYEVTVDASGGSVSPSGLQTKTLSAVIIAGGTTTLDFALAGTTGSVSGTVTTGSPAVAVEDVVVKLKQNGNTIYIAETDSSGDYSFSGVAPGNYVVEASDPDYQQSIQGVIVTSGGSHTVDFLLDVLAASLVGTCTSATTGEAIEGMLVECYRDNILVASALTDSTGQYTIEGLESGLHVLHTQKEGWHMLCAVVDCPLDQIVNENFSVTPGSTAIEGYITDADTTAAIAGASVQVYLDNAQVFSTVTNNDGYYKITGATSRMYEGLVKAANYQGIAFSQSLTAGIDNRVDKALEPSPATVTGTVTATSGGAAIESCVIEARSGNLILDVTVTDSSGNYSFTMLPAETITIHARKRDYQAKFSEVTLTAGGSSTLDFSLDGSPGTITGIVTDGLTGLARPNINLLLTTSAGQVVDSSLTQRIGTYTIDTLAPGDYYFTARFPLYVQIDQTDTFTVTAGNTTTQNITIWPKDAPPTSLSGSVILNVFATQVDRIKKITWTPSVSPKVVSQCIQRNGFTIATVSAATTEFLDHNRPEDTLDTYSVCSVNSDGSESSAVSVEVR